MNPYHSDGFIGHVDTKGILGERLLISSLSGKASGMLVDIPRLSKKLNMRSRSRAW